MHRFFSHIIDYVFPPLCFHCQQEGSWLCATAKTEIVTIPVLTDPLAIEGVDRIICRGDYDVPLLGQIIQRVKYDFLTAPARGIFPVLFEKITPSLCSFPGETVIVPIPLHWRRQMSRGFNQSELIARALSDVTGLTINHLLKRRRGTTPQAKLNGQERIRNVSDAFRLHPGTTIPTRVVLVDDVITTGSTIKECAAVLRAAGVQKIIAVALAKG